MFTLVLVIILYTVLDYHAEEIAILFLQRAVLINNHLSPVL